MRGACRLFIRLAATRSANESCTCYTARELAAPVMQCTLLIPRLFWPGDTSEAIARDLALRGLKKLVSRARFNRYPAVSSEAWLCQAFELERQRDWPIAPLTLALDGREPGHAYWLRADPVHLKIERDRLLLVDSSLFALTTDEAHALIATLNAHFSGLGVTFHVGGPKRWYAKLERPPDLVTHAISEVAGRDVRGYLPEGADALAWHAIFNEVQMLMHEHAVNSEREGRNEPPVNSVWFWGGGTLATVAGRHFDGVWSANEVAIALAAAAHTRAEPLPSDAHAWLTSAAARPHPRASHLVVLEDLSAAVAYHDPDAWRTRITALDAQWLAPLATALGQGRIREISIVAPGEASCSRFDVSRMDLLKIWRRPKVWSAYA